MNQGFEQWVGDARNYPDSLKIVMWHGVKMPVKNFMCPLCNSKENLEKMKMATAVDPECTHPETQAIIHSLRGWNNCALALQDNIVYHKDCLQKKLGKKFAKLVSKGEILTE